ncbi:MAG: PAS domain S-box protein, partial [Desulfobacterales bacterium]
MQSSLEELRERIRRLEAENQRLLEYAEKTRLDGLTAESINNVQIGTTFLGNGTEKIREINGALGPGVEERIQELNRTNKQLQNEIKECRRSEKTLKESENKFRELFHKALDAIYLWEVRDDGTIGRCLEVNDVACKMLGFSRAEILSFTPRDLDDEESARKISGIVKELTARGNKRFEMTHVTKDGRKVPVEINAHIFSLNDKKVVLSLARDITERRRAQEALRESEQRFKTAFLTSPDAININRLEDGLYIDVNLGFTALTGYTRDDVIGKTSLEINIWHDPADRERLVAGLQRSGQVSNLEAKFRIKDGRVRTGLMSAKVIELDEIPHVLSITRDIEDMKKAEEELLRLATAVEQAAESIIVTDKDGIIKYVNPAFEKTMGYNGEEMIGQNIRIFKSNGHKEAYSKIWHTISSGMVWSGHIVSRAKDGRLR